MGLSCLPHLWQLNLAGNCIRFPDDVVHLKVIYLSILDTI